MPLSFVQLNIETDKHLEKIRPLLASRRPDVVCLQELFEDDIPFFEELLGATCFFVRMKHYTRESRGLGVEGLGIFSRYPMLSTASYQFGGIVGEAPEYDNSSPEAKHETERFMLAVAEIEKDGEAFRIGTTHFPVTRHGEADDLQRAALARFLAITENLGEFVVTGDFNAPRGREVFTALAERFRDNVPAIYATSIDGSIHRAGALPYMVDGVFSTEGYDVSAVEMICGVSDHCALAGTIAKA